MEKRQRNGDCGIAMETVAQLSSHLQSGKRDPVDLAEEALGAIAASDDQAIFIDILAERALREAKAARERLKSGLPASRLDGVPIGWKDLFDIEGRVTTAGSEVLKSDPPAKTDAALVASAKRLGMVSIGTLNMTEFAYSGIGLNPHYGTPRNPNSKVHRSPGGSSSACGVAVAKGLLPVAIGTDTGGSIRIPASFNGVVGYKTSTGHYPMDGVFPLSRSYDTLGPLAQTVEDCVIVDAALCGLKAPKITERAIGGLEFLVPVNVMFDGVEDAVQVNFESALSRISMAGGKIKRATFSAFDAILRLVATRGNILGAEALHVHWDRVNGPDARRMDSRVVQRIKLADKMTAVDLVEVMAQRNQLITQTRAQIGDAIVVCPTTPHVAMTIAPLEADMEEFFRANIKTLRNTMIGNFLDWCGLSIPSGSDRDNMPTGFLLSAPHGRDADILSSGLALESLIRNSRG
jgi:aspartyl-tRNA(Asn)/glutamyl-tRNA(Gln) amidotransferase subunit A